VDDAAFDKIINTNVKSNFWLSNMVAPSMAKRGGGSIIIVSSIAGLMGTSGIGVYGISKAADMQLARNLAIEWGPDNVRANCICPGLVKTDFAKALWENKDALAKVINATPLRRVGEPDDIAGVALFLAADESRFVTGQYIIADGGGTITDHM
ncbi:MAG: SDR family oxidoreductase, partial [Sphingomonadales bacterium]|nr:SDR family oxidoreductase [Sphingomonadales bacterium]